MKPASMKGTVSDGALTDRVATVDVIADLLSYPGADFRRLVALLGSSINTVPGVTELALAFEAATAGLSNEEIEELYTRTFDFNPDASLETGWQLFGETYERGAYLVKMRQLLRSCAIAESGELPDHLSYLLRVVGRLSEEESGLICSMYLRKSVGKMAAAVVDRDNPYLKLLEAASLVIDAAATPKESVQL